ncbi:glycoside hydrolase family 73 protein [Paraburkholderia rhynchosiae]|uniref:Mannosyl-glycoprotein endo-beta-N-acetylglucosamidase n=1 Tax=Paraburkholderia rhynchosiae TaxID=487049 RepID=A0A2N7W9D7_9BURK|nr:glucosaminidase domain-containing protein [Paraburkholderia rhynchosiae]PMS26017.1 mannosyl-glycoprotein endo-beta-N-acetylglucosamidase [Paraburkholderia rhynchosiae]CAB3731240.1 Peptidoglycan hydrolase FlgJ [Paraburkholderia rhynchosiae]
MAPQDFINAIASAAQASAALTNIPAGFVVADAALESGWGSSGLTRNAMNLFGVKADKSWTGSTYAVPTREFLNGQWTMVNALFRKYSDWLGSIQDHAAFLINNPRYAPAFLTTDSASFAKAVAAAGYATDPQYAQKIIAILNAHNLASLDAPVQPAVST